MKGLSRIRLDELIYYNVPVWAQNVLLSFYGYLLFKKRYGEPGFTESFENIRKNTKLSKDEIAALQLSNCKRIINYAYEHVPYYYKEYRNIDFNPKDINRLEDIKMLPIVEKDTIQRNPYEFISDDFNKNKLIIINTSGTSGKPLKIYCNSRVLQTNYAYFTYFKQLMGINKFDRTATFAGRVITPGYKETLPFWRKNIWMNTLLFSSYHLSDKNMASYIQKLNEFKPIMIDAYPSAIYVLAKYTLENDLFVHSPRAILTSSETLLDHQRETIEKAFKAKVFDHYSSAEMVANIFQCHCGSYHLYPDYGYVEFLSNDGKDVVDEPGHMVCTGFINPVMPLIRYRIGDTGVLSSKDCCCGSSLPVIQTLEGRIDSIVKTKSGKKIGRLDPIFKGLCTIRDCQIYQLANYDIILKIVKSFDFNPLETEMLMRELRKRVGDETKIIIEYVDSIQRTSSGKIQAVVSHAK